MDYWGGGGGGAKGMLPPPSQIIGGPANPPPPPFLHLCISVWKGIVKLPMPINKCVSQIRTTGAVNDVILQRRMKSALQL